MLNIDIETLRQMRADGVTNTDIRRHFGCSKTTLEKVVKANNLPPKTRWPALDMGKLRTEWMAGVSSEKIAKALGCSATRVRDVAKAEGLPQRDHGGRRGGCEPIAPRKPSQRPRHAYEAVPYAEVNALADANGWTIQRAQQECHRMRGRV